MSVLSPNRTTGFSPALSNDVPPYRDFYVEVVYGPGTFDRADYGSGERTSITSRSAAVDLGISTATCDATTGIDITIRTGADFCPLMLGWTETTWNGSSYSYTDHETALSTSATHFNYDNTAGPPPYTYREAFKIWRKL